MKRLLLTFLLGISLITVAQFKYCQEDLFPAQGENRLWGYVNLWGEWKILPLYTKTFAFRGATAKIQQGVKYGAIDCHSKMIIAPSYDEILDFIAGVAWVRKNALWGLIDENGKVILEPKFERVEDVGRFSDYTWVREGEKWGVYDKFQLKWVYPPRFRVKKILSREYALVKENGMYGVVNCADSIPLYPTVFENVAKIAPYKLIVKKNDKWGMIKDNGEEVLPVEFDTISVLSKTKFKVSKSGKVAIVDFRGRMLTSSYYDQLGKYSNQRIWYLDNGLYGYLNSAGKEVIKARYANVSSFIEGRALVKLNQKYQLINMQGETAFQNGLIEALPANGYYAFSKNGYWGVVSSSGRLISEAQFSQLEKDEGYVVRVKKNNVWHLLNMEEGALSPEPYDSIFKSYAGYYVVKSQGKFGLINTSGELMIPVIYENLSYEGFVGKYLFLFKKGESHGFVSAEGEEVFVSEANVLSLVGNKVVVEKKGKQGLYDLAGEEIFRMKYDEVKTFDGVSSHIGLRRKSWALARTDGSLLTEYVYNEIKALQEYFVVRDNVGYGVLNNGGEKLGELVYDEVSSFDGKYFSVAKSGKIGYLDRRGRLVVKPTFDEVKSFIDDLAVARIEDLWGVINRRGNWVLEPKYTLGQKRGVNYYLVGTDRDFEVSDKVIEVLK